MDAYLVFKLSGIILFVAGAAYAARRHGLSPVKMTLLAAAGAFTGYLFSTFWYIFQNSDMNAVHTVEDWAGLMDSSGSVLYGWMLGVSTGVYAFSKAFKLPVKKVFFFSCLMRSRLRF